MSGRKLLNEKIVRPFFLLTKPSLVFTRSFNVQVLRHILVCGELGTGKDIVASTVYQLFKLTGVIKARKEGVPKSGSVEKKTIFEIVLSKWTDPDEVCLRAES